MANRIKKGDLVKIISGDNKGQTAKVVEIKKAKNQVILEGIGKRTRHVAKSYYNPMGGKKEIQQGIDISKVALVVDEKSGKTSRVGYEIDKNGNKVRVARQNGNKAIDKVAKTAKKGAK